MKLLFVTLIVAAALAYGCITWHGTLLCVFIALVLAAAVALLLGVMRELWILHQFGDM